MHMLHSVGRAAGLVDFVTIDTLHLFPETYALVGRTRAQYSLDLKVYRPFNVSTEAEFNASFGADLWLTNPSAYAFVTKVEPMHPANDPTRALPAGEGGTVYRHAQPLVGLGHGLPHRA